MKKYVKPLFEVAQVRVNERIAATSCTEYGTCYNSGWTHWDCDKWTTPTYDGFN